MNDMVYWGWDEINNDYGELGTPSEQREIDEEGGWEVAFSLPNGVTFHRTDRHWAISAGAPTKEDAIRLIDEARQLIVWAANSVDPKAFVVQE